MLSYIFFSLVSAISNILVQILYSKVNNWLAGQLVRNDIIPTLGLFGKPHRIGGESDGGSSSSNFVPWFKDELDNLGIMKVDPKTPLMQNLKGYFGKSNIALVKTRLAMVITVITAAPQNDICPQGKT